MTEENINWQSFRKRIVISKPVAEVYTAWTKSAEIDKWFLETANYIDENKQRRKADEPVQKGDKFTWKWHNWDFEEKGTILDANGADFVSFTFGTGGNVHVQMKPVKSGTEVILTQDEIPTDEKSKREIYVGCATGWTFWLANLKAWLEHGITLHATGLAQSDTADLVNS